MHFSFQHNRSTYCKSQPEEVFKDHDYTMVKNIVLVSHDGIITKIFSGTSPSKHAEFTTQKISGIPTLSENEIISRLFIRESFQNTNLPKKITDVIADSYRATTGGRYELIPRQWFVYATSRSTNLCTPDVNIIHESYVHK